MAYKVLVTGSREWAHPTAIKRRLRELPPGTTIIHGAARGADSMAGLYARALGFTVQEFPVHWRPGGVYNPRAGFERNLRMLDQEPDLVLAFQRNGSGGTQHTINSARARGIPVEVFTA